MRIQFLASLCLILFQGCASKYDLAVDVPEISINTILPKDISQDKLYIHTFDVGSGSCVLIIPPENEDLLLYDCGSSNIPNHTTRTKLRKKIYHFIHSVITDKRKHFPEQQIKLDVVLSHAHPDHGNFLPYLVSKLDSEKLIGKMLNYGKEKYFPKNMREHLIKPKIGALKQTNISTYNLDIVAVGVPGKDKNPNSESIVLLVRYGDFSTLLTGDAEGSTEKEILKNTESIYPNFANLTVLFSSHHGSATSGSNGDYFYQKLKPKIVIYSAGEFFGHPNKETVITARETGSLIKSQSHDFHYGNGKLILRRLEREETELAEYTTELSGNITIETDGKTISLLCERDDSCGIDEHPAEIISLAAASRKFTPKDESHCILNDDYSCTIFGASGITIDNDLFAFGTNGDRNYTYGLNWNWRNEDAKRHILYLGGFFEGFLSEFKPKDITEENVIYEPQLQFSITNFTPQDIAEHSVIETDRPYSSLIGLHNQNSISYFDINGDPTSHTLGLTIGYVGADFGGSLQAGWHEILRSLGDCEGKSDIECEPEDPKGWHHQVSNGGEWTAKLHYGFDKTLIHNEEFDFSYSLDFDLGYYTKASAGVIGRWSFLDRFPKSMSAVSRTSPMFPNGAGVEVIGNQEPEESYTGITAFIGVNAVYIPYNGFLTCLSRTSDHCLNQDNVEKFLWEGHAGFIINSLTENGWPSITVSWHARTKEHNLANAHPHYWGTIGFQWRFY